MKQTRKILCMVISMVMLLAICVPAMAEGESVTILDLGDKTNVVTYQADTNDGYALGTVNFDNTGASANPITDRVFETGFSVKTSGGASAADYVYLQVGNKASYPIVEAKFSYNDKEMHTVTLKYAEDNYVLQEGEWKHNDWNDIKFVVKITGFQTISETSYSIQAPFTVDMYINGSYLNTFSGTYKPNTESGSEEFIKPYRTRTYKTKSSNTLQASVNNIYLAKYNSVTSFVQESVSTTVICGQEAALPATVNVAVNNVNEAVSVTWNDVDTSAAGTKTVTGVVEGYTNSDASPVTVTATVVVTEPPFPYELAIADNTLTVTKVAVSAPESTVYGAVYEEGLLRDVHILGTITGTTEWTDSKITIPLDEGKIYRAFVVDDQLIPYAISTSLD